MTDAFAKVVHLRDFLRLVVDLYRSAIAEGAVGASAAGVSIVGSTIGVSTVEGSITGVSSAGAAVWQR